MRLLPRFLATVPLLVLCAASALPAAAQWTIEYRDIDWSGGKGQRTNPAFMPVGNGSGVLAVQDAGHYFGRSEKTSEAKANVKFKVYAIWGSRFTGTQTENEHDPTLGTSSSDVP